jgi:hypothetical protein
MAAALENISGPLKPPHVILNSFQDPGCSSAAARDGLAIAAALLAR